MGTGKKNISGVSDDVTTSIKNDLLSKNSGLSGFLESKKIGISISETEELNHLGFSVEHLEDAMVEFARHSLIQGAQLVYGGDLRKRGFTRILSELSYQYRNRSEHKKRCVFNYSSYPIYLKMTNADELELKKNRVEIVKVSPPENIGLSSEKFFKPDTFPNKCIWADSLTKMREEMNKFTNASIFIGGRTKDYLGAMPGVMEEALIAMRLNKPIYLIGAFGGTTMQLINAIQGNKSPLISTEYQIQDKEYATFHEKYGKINYEVLTKEFNEYGMKTLSNDNGLSAKENKILFSTKHVPEMVFYVMTGLKRLSN